MCPHGALDQESGAAAAHPLGHPYQPLVRTEPSRHAAGGRPAPAAECLASLQPRATCRWGAGVPPGSPQLKAALERIRRPAPRSGGRYSLEICPTQRQDKAGTVS